jgi:glycosyltransferase EpsD
LYNIDGVGVDLARFYPHSASEKEILRHELGYSKDDFIIINVAEINRNKNQIMLIQAIPALKKCISNLKVLFVGKDNYPKVRKTSNDLSLNNIVSFLGYRNDVDKLTAISDIAFSASLREGLPVNIIEAMACGIPVVCSKNRGHNQLIEHGLSGMLFSVNNVTEIIDCVTAVYQSPELTKKIANAALERSKIYDTNIIMQEMAAIYHQYMN